jgi:hypothetical protein
MAKTAPVQLRWRWWLRWYLYGVVTMHALTGLRPDMDRVTWWIRRGLTVKVVKN